MGGAKPSMWLMVAVALGLFVGSILLQVRTDVPSEVITVNPSGAAGSALVVYHPGLSSFQEDVTMAFATGLADAGWRCDVTTASRKAPHDLAGYDLLVLGAQAYQWQPARPVRRYVERLGDLGGLATAILVTGAGSTDRAASLLEGQLADAGGMIAERLELWQDAPNEEVHGIEDVVQIARSRGAALTLP
ncbi:MAG: hypothetical protein JSW65_02475 [Candidatus Bipolaricaulota bacterium]|nr:MAG: hypothetical protein JSW65_02475 [Candidatus Bipolaricaulota bacterium]